MHAIGLCTVSNRATSQRLDKAVISGGEGRFEYSHNREAVSELIRPAAGRVCLKVALVSGEHGGARPVPCSVRDARRPTETTVCGAFPRRDLAKQEGVRKSSNKTVLVQPRGILSVLEDR
jgi:hypothetical protein